MYCPVDCLDQGLADFFYEGPENKYFQLCKPYSSPSRLPKAAVSAETAKDGMAANGWGGVPIKFYLQKQAVGHGLPTPGRAQGSDEENARDEN